MGNYIFSPSKNAFYPFELKTSYEATDSWPEDGVDVEDSIFIEFTGIPPEGMIRGVSDKNMPVWVLRPEPTHDELIANAEAKKQYLIEQANDFINSKQWPGKAALGRLKDPEKEQYNLWLDYLDALEAVDSSSAPDINWPESPEE